MRVYATNSLHGFAFCHGQEERSLAPPLPARLTEPPTRNKGSIEAPWEARQKGCDLMPVLPSESRSHVVTGIVALTLALFVIVSVKLGARDSCARRYFGTAILRPHGSSRRLGNAASSSRRVPTDGSQLSVPVRPQTRVRAVVQISRAARPRCEEFVGTEPGSAAAASQAHRSRLLNRLGEAM